MANSTMTAAVFVAAGVAACNLDVPGDATAGADGTAGAMSTSDDGATTGVDASRGGSGGSGGDSAGSDDEGLKLDVGDPDDPGIPPLPEPVPFPTTCDEAAEIPSSVGCEFYPLALPQGTGQWGDTAFLVSNVAPGSAHVVLEDRDGVVAELDLAPGESQPMIVGSDHQLLAQSGLQLRGYRLTSNAVLQVFVVVPPQRTPTADASIALPVNALGQRHRIATYPGNGGFVDLGQQWVSIVAPGDETEVTVEIVGEDTVTLMGNGYPALDASIDGQDQFTATLDALEVLVVAASPIDPESGEADNDLTGSLVLSNKPVAVYSGTLPVYVPQPPIGESLCCADLLAEAVPPTTALGWRYAAVKFDPLGAEPDVWRFVGDHDGTVVTLSGGVDDVLELDAGELVDVQTPESFVAEGTRPFALLHFMTGSEMVAGSQKGPAIDTVDCGPVFTPGDPAMSWVYPRGNWLTRYLFTVDISDGAPWCRDRLTVVAAADEWDLIEHNGRPLPEGTPLADGELLRAYIGAEEGTHDLVAPDDVGFEVTAYGYADDGSYVFAGGVGVQVLNPAG